MAAGPGLGPPVPLSRGLAVPAVAALRCAAFTGAALGWAWLQPPALRVSTLPRVPRFPVLLRV
jgi:hypothetical protein